MKPRVVLATANPDKAIELKSALDGAGLEIELVDRPDSVPEVEETGGTLEANARLKAMALSAATGLSALADDTGLEVDELGGSPGVFSARFAGPAATYADNVEHLLHWLGGVPDERRTARFVTVIVVANSDGSELVSRGILEGSIASEPRGTYGFGYDSVFIPRSTVLTLAELTPNDKNAISHRSLAIADLAILMRESGWPTSKE